MDVVFRVLGLAAAVGSRTNRFSINLIKFNWLIMGLLAYGLVGATQELRYAIANGTTPRKLTVAEATAHTDIDRNFVEVHGELINEPAFQITKSRHSSTAIEASFFPLLDEAHRHAVLVRTRGDATPRADGGITDIAGMLMPIDTKLRAELVRSRAQFGQLAVDLDYVLELDREPGKTSTFAIAAAVLATLLLAMLKTWKDRFVVFRAIGPVGPAGAAASAPVGDDPLPLEASGTFRLDGKAQRFTSVPTALVAKDGAPVLCAHIDASSSFMGMKTSSRVGVWCIELGKDRPEVETGMQYFGVGRRPALRVRHTDQGKDATTVLSFDNAAARDAALQILAPS